MRPTYATLSPLILEKLVSVAPRFVSGTMPRESYFEYATPTSSTIISLAQMHAIFSLARRRPDLADAQVQAWAQAAQFGLQLIAKVKYSAASEAETEASGTAILRMGPYSATDVKMISGLAASFVALDPATASTALTSVMEFLDALADTTGTAHSLKSSPHTRTALSSRLTAHREFNPRDSAIMREQQAKLDAAKARAVGSGAGSGVGSTADSTLANPRLSDLANTLDIDYPNDYPNDYPDTFHASIGPRQTQRAKHKHRQQRARTDLMRRVEEHAVGQVNVSFRVDLPTLPPGENTLELAPGEVARKHDIGAQTLDLVTAMERDLPFTLTAQIHSSARPGEVKDAEVLWLSNDHGFGLDARSRVHAELRRAGQRWLPLQALGSGNTLDALELRNEDLDDLLSSGAAKLASVGFTVHWPKELSKQLHTSLAVAARSPGSAKGAVREKDETHSDALFAGLGAFELQWRIALGDDPLTAEEVDALAESQRPIVRLRNEWVVLDPSVVAKARRRVLRALNPLEAMESALLGVLEHEGETTDVTTNSEVDEYLESLQRIGDLNFMAAHRINAPEALAGQLRDYQLAGLRWLAALTERGLGGVLADDMGLGKTITVIALHLHREAVGLATLPHPGARDGYGLLAETVAGYEGGRRPTLIVCPASLLGNWEREIMRFAPGTRVRRYHGVRRNLDDWAAGGFVLTTYGTMQRDAEKLAGVAWGLVVADEAQHVKNPHAKAAKSLRLLGEEARCGRIALSGTPVENNLSELWALLDWVTPGLLGPLKYFRSVWAGPIERGSPDKDHDAELVQRFKRMIAPFVLRRRKSDPGVAPELPDKVLTDQFVDLTREQVALYEATLREAMARIEEVEGIHRRGLVLKLLTGLKQICNHPMLFTREAGTGSFASRSGKVQLLDELLETIVAEGQATLIFTQYARMGNLLSDHLATHGLRTQFLSGSTSIPHRENMVENFQAGNCDAFVLSLRAAGTGLNLTRAEHVIHFDRWWNPAVEAQATDRAYRIGQTKTVQVHKLICSGTLEEKIAQLMAEKAELAETILGGGAESLTNLSDSDLRGLLSLGRS